MMKRWLPHLLLLSLLVPLLVACGGITDTEPKADSVQQQVIQDQYPLESVNRSGSQTSYVYRAVNTPVKEVTAKLVAKRKPEQQSKPDDQRMFLLYPNELIHVQQDPKKPKDTLIEVDSKEYVKKNYSPGFLEGYLLANVMNKLFGKNHHSDGHYRGYGTKDTYQPKGSYHAPTMEEKKTSPPMTVDRTGSIFRRSANADTSSSRVIRSGRDDYTSRSEGTKWRSSNRGPSIKSGSGRMTRRR